MYAERRENPVKGSERTESERVERNFDKVFGGTLRHVVYPYAAELIQQFVGYTLSCLFVYREMMPEETPFTDLMGASILVSTLWARSSSCTSVPEH